MIKQYYSASAREDPEDFASQATILTRSTCNTNIAGQSRLNKWGSFYLGEIGILAELHLLQHESPDVVAETVGVEFVGLVMIARC